MKVLIQKGSKSDKEVHRKLLKYDGDRLYVQATFSFSSIFPIKIGYLHKYPYDENILS